MENAAHSTSLSCTEGSSHFPTSDILSAGACCTWLQHRQQDKASMSLVPSSPAYQRQDESVKRLCLQELLDKMQGMQLFDPVLVLPKEVSRHLQSSLPRQTLLHVVLLASAGLDGDADALWPVRWGQQLHHRSRSPPAGLGDCHACT